MRNRRKHPCGPRSSESARPAAVSVWEFVARIWQHCRSRPRLVAIIVVACAIETGFFWIVPLSVRSLIDNAIGQRDRQHLILVLGGLLSGVLVASIASLQRGRSYAHLQGQVLSDLRFLIFRKLQRLPDSYFSTTSEADVLTRASSDLGAIEAALGISLTWGLMPTLDAAVGTVVLFVLDWRLAAIAALVWPWCVLVPARLAPTVHSESYERRRREAQTLGVMQQAIAAHRIIRAYDLEKDTTCDFVVKDADLFTSSVRTNFLLALMDQGAIVGMLLIQVAVIGIGAWLAVAGSITIGTLAAFQSLCLSVSTSLLWSSQYSRDVLPARAGLRRIDELLTHPEIELGQQTALPMKSFRGAIELVDVAFCCDGRPLLDRVNLRIPRGAFVGIIGASGAGKSTLISLLLRFADPTEGAILVDGIDLRAINQRSWLAHLGVVFQDNYLFDKSVRENIRLGCPHASDEMVERAARQAEIHEAIVRLPHGYDTLMGERGRRFSGGERQRIALARALVRDPAILLLDEAGSGLDPATDAAIAETIRLQVGHRTVISITHRLESITSADIIAVMGGGRILEAGTHEELMAGSGTYAHLCVPPGSRAHASRSVAVSRASLHSPIRSLRPSSPDLHVAS